MRRGAIINKTPYCTTISAASAACDAAIALRSRSKQVMSLQERYGRVTAPVAAAGAVD
jgi:carbamoyl-phosphate synthase large subunit